jgi:hypothetical protein
MATWSMSDGTIVRLGGEVEGASLFALQLRTTIDEGNAAITWPGREYTVDLSDLAQCDAFVRERAAHARLKVSGPKNVPELPPPPDPVDVVGLDPGELDADNIY